MSLSAQPKPVLVLKRPVLWGILITIIFIVFLSTPDGLWAARKKGTDFDPATIDLDDYKGFPKRLDGMGWIQRLGEGQIVIDDEGFRLADSVAYHTPRNKFAPAGWFTVGDYVGFLVNDQGEIVSLWRFYRAR